MPVPTLTAQSPSFGRISWPAFSIQYAGVAYAVPAYNTDKKFTWWKYNAGSPTLHCQDQLPDGRLKNGAITNGSFSNADADQSTLAANWTLEGWPGHTGANTAKRVTRVLAPLPGELWSQSKWTRNFAGGVTEPSPDTFRKTSGAGDWINHSVYSSEGYRKNAYVSFTAEGDGDWMVGLNSDPTSANNYESIDYCWHLSGGANWYIFENGVGTHLGIAQVAGDVCLITYDGTNVRYYLNGVLRKTTARASGAPLYLDSSFYNVAATGVSNLKFGPMDEYVNPEYALELKTGPGAVADVDSAGAGTDELYGVTPGQTIYYQIEVTAPVDTAGFYFGYNKQDGTEVQILANYTVGPTTNNMMQGSFVVPAGVTGIQPWTLLYRGTSASNVTVYVKSIQISLTPIQTQITADDVLLFLNKNGVPATAQSAAVLDGSLIVSESIYAASIAANQITGNHILAGEIDATHIAVGSINTNHIQSGSIKAELLESNLLAAGFILTGKLQVGTHTWTPQEGLIIPGVVVLPGMAGGVASFSGNMTASQLTVQKDFTLLGNTNFIQGTLTLGNGITRPTGTPSVYASWSQVGTTREMPFGPIHYGLCENLTDSTVLLSAENFFGGAIVQIYKSNNVGWVPAANGAQYGTDFLATQKAYLTNFSPSGGIIAFSGAYFILGQDNARNSQWYIYRLNTSFDKTHEVYVGESNVFGSARPAIGHDGTNVIFGFALPPNTFQINKYAPANLAYNTYNQWSSFPNIQSHSTSHITAANYDFGQQRYVIALESNNNFVTDMTGFRGGDALAFAPAAGHVVRGLWWDGTRFWSLGADGSLYKHATNTLAQTATVSHTWYDGDAGGTGTHETEETTSPATFVRPPRTFLNVQTPEAPDSGDTAVKPDKANRVGVYIGIAGGSRRLQIRPGIDGASRSIRDSIHDVINTGSATPPASNGFSGAQNSPGILKTAGATSTQGVILNGDGSGSVAGMQWNAAGAFTSTKHPMEDTGWVAFPYAGSGWTDTGFGWADARYRRIGRMLYIRGLPVRSNGLTAAAGSNLNATALPADCRPAGIYTGMFQVLNSNGDDIAGYRVDFTPSGFVQTKNAIPAACYVSLQAAFCLD